MIISLSWLRDFVNVNASAQEIADRLSVSGLEVEHLGLWESLPGGLKGFVTGEVIECAKHPNADKLSVTKVDIGAGELQPIVCGAPNVAAGQIVIVATPGAVVTVPGKGTFTIGEAKLRGEISRGMICAEDEIGTGTSHDGILVLPPETPVGMPAAEYFGLDSDEFLEIGLTANRGDAASHLGVARDVAALFSTEVQFPEIPARPLATGRWNIQVADAGLCSTYVALSISDTQPLPSPPQIQNRLKVLGIESKNVLVDATNYTLHSLGQPIHAFDADKIRGNTIYVRQANAGEKITTLDKTERQCKGGELVIADEGGIIALAGVMGGLDAAVTENTKNVILESAHFHPGLVRKTARMHGISTDASFRFERGTDPLLCRNAAFYAADLILSAARGSVNACNEVTAVEHQVKTIEISTTRLSGFAGAVIPGDQAADILKNLGFRPRIQGDLISVTVPSWRNDVEGEVDVYEEVMRIYGYDQIPMSGKMNASLPDFKGVKGYRRQWAAARFLVAHGFVEIMNNSLTSARFYTPDELTGMVKLTNPLSSDMEWMRGSLQPGMLQAAQYNRNRKLQNIRFFEFGRVYQHNGNEIAETDMLGILMGGNSLEESWEPRGRTMDFYYARQITAALFKTLGISGADVNISEVSQAQRKMFDLEGEFWYAEINWSKLKNVRKPAVKVTSPPKFPWMRRDLSLVVDAGTTFEQLEQVIQKNRPEILKDLNVFDVFEGKPLDEGKKAVAVAFYLGKDEETLTDEFADAAMARLISEFEKAGAVIRR